MLVKPAIGVAAAAIAIRLVASIPVHIRIATQMGSAIATSQGGPAKAKASDE